MGHLFRPQGAQILASDDADKGKRGSADDAGSLQQELLEQRALTDRLRAELDDYRLLVEHSNDLVVKIDLRGRFLFVSPSYCALFGLAAEELLGKTFMPLVHEDDRSSTAHAMEQLFTPPHTSFMEQRAMTKLGWRWLAWSDRGLLNDAGQVVAIVGVGRDITEQKLAEVALKESEARYRQLFENMSDGVAIYEAVDDGKEFVFLEINRAAENILRIDRSKVIGQRVCEMFPGVEDLGLAEVFRRVWKSGEPEYHPMRHYADERLALWVDNFVLKLPHGEIVAIFEDLSAQKKAEQRLRESEKRLRESQAYAHVGFWELKPERQGAVWSDEVYRIAGISPETKAGPETLKELVHPEDLSEVLASLERSLSTGQEHHIEYRLVRPDGEQRWVECRARASGGAQGKPEKLVGFLQDITERKSAELALAQSEERFELAMRGANDGVFDWDLRSNAIYFSPRWKSMLGYADEELPNTLATWEKLIEPAQREEVQAILGAYKSGQRDHFELEFQMRHKDGRPVDILARAYVLKDDSGKAIRVVGTHVDVSARKQAEKEIQHLAFHDSLTQLPNRLLFMETLEQVMANYRRSGQQLAVHVFDLDHFKEVNDSLGHPVGDELLQAVAQRISALLRGSDLFARLGGDEFALIQQGVGEPGMASALAEKINAAVAEPFPLADNVIHTSVSIGIMIPQSPEVDVTRLMSYADVAMYKAKEAGRGTYAFFEDAMTEQLQGEMRLFDQLRDAVDAGELFLLYQPQYALQTGRLVGLEGLLRWRHPERGLLLPESFLRIAERRGFIRRLSGFVLEQSCRQARDWLDRGVPFGCIAVNLCASQINRVDIFDSMIATVESFGLGAEHIEFELSETALIESNEQVHDAIGHLVERGYRFAVDEFGVGFAPFALLRRLHTHKLKIAPNFIADIASDPKAAVVVESLVGLGRALDMQVVAEGVEHERQAEVLRGFGCELAQGGLYGTPSTAEQTESLLLATAPS